VVLLVKSGKLPPRILERGRDLFDKDTLRSILDGLETVVEAARENHIYNEGAHAVFRADHKLQEQIDDIDHSRGVRMLLG